jgi:hypothetical protein
VTRRRWILVAAAAACLVLAAFAAMAARDVGEWQSALRRGDVESAADGRKTAPSWSVGELTPFGLARSLLGVNDDLAFRRGVSLFSRAHIGIPSFEAGLEGSALRVQAEAALARAIRSDRNRRRAADAENLLGVLVVVDSTLPGGTSTPIERAIFQFQDAIHLDPGNDEAKKNLELIYQLTAPPDTPRGSLRREGRSHSGASATSPGHGY